MELNKLLATLYVAFLFLGEVVCIMHLQAAVVLAHVRGLMHCSAGLPFCHQSIQAYLFVLCATHVSGWRTGRAGCTGCPGAQLLLPSCRHCKLDDGAACGHQRTRSAVP